ncbi:hypothetical protein EVAR_65334_1 [Eumeta japonica]|uniref:Uncharacterized protein n=1 Tax=Eumeta variegata TaxID=151549 RepID=A0A4C1YVH9_EUMVA|nr:hypothetical protein EVAR_65334_1 [Eumeta japonica]
MPRVRRGRRAPVPGGRAGGRIRRTYFAPTGQRPAAGAGGGQRTPCYLTYGPAMHKNVYVKYQVLMVALYAIGVAHFERLLSGGIGESGRRRPRPPRINEPAVLFVVRRPRSADRPRRS